MGREHTFAYFVVPPIFREKFPLEVRKKRSGALARQVSFLQSGLQKTFSLGLSLCGVALGYCSCVVAGVFIVGSFWV